MSNIQYIDVLTESFVNKFNIKLDETLFNAISGLVRSTNESDATVPESS